MNRTLLALAALTTLTAPLAGCAGRAAAQPADARVLPIPPSSSMAPMAARWLRVRADGRVSVKPDVALVEAGVRVTAKDAQKASADANGRMKALLAELQRLGIPEKDVQTSQFTLVAERPWENGRQLPVQGYTSSNTVRVKVRKLEVLPELLGRLTAVGVNAIDSVQFAKDELGPSRDEALALAVAAARARAEALAKASGVTLGEVLTIEAQPMSPVMPLGANMAMRSMKAEGDAPVAEGELEISASVEVVFAIR